MSASKDRASSKGNDNGRQRAASDVTQEALDEKDDSDKATDLGHKIIDEIDHQLDKLDAGEDEEEDSGSGSGLPEGFNSTSPDGDEMEVVKVISGKDRDRGEEKPTPTPDSTDAGAHGGAQQGAGAATQAVPAPTQGAKQPPSVNVDEVDDVKRLMDSAQNTYVLTHPHSLVAQMELHEDRVLLRDLVVMLVATAGGGLVATMLRQPAILGYLVAGSAIGPGGFALIDELVQIETISKLGLVLLLFALGIEFRGHDLRHTKAVAVGGTTIIVGLFVGVGGALGAAVGGTALGIFVGAFLSMSSTAVVLKCLVEFRQSDTRFGQITLAVLIVQDCILGCMLAVLPAFASGTASAARILNDLGRMVAFLGGAFLVSRYALPHLLRLMHVFETRGNSGEVSQLSAIGLCLCVASIAEELKLGMEVGAFIAGLMVSAADEEQVHRTLQHVEAVRNIFAAVFLTTLGMLMQPAFLWNNKVILMVAAVLVFSSKVAVTAGVVRAFRYPSDVALCVGVATAQIGEFSFVLLSRGRALGLISRKVYLLLLGTTALSLLLTPFQWRVINPLVDGETRITNLVAAAAGAGPAAGGHGDDSSNGSTGNGKAQHGGGEHHHTERHNGYEQVEKDSEDEEMGKAGREKATTGGPRNGPRLSNNAHARIVHRTQSPAPRMA
ncbi:unnamed protein product [Pedinophyceae sp. YPF-701]|nr:unnamed protein product [Pedinophyceae sp. YPF-701]